MCDIATFEGLMHVNEHFRNDVGQPRDNFRAAGDAVRNVVRVKTREDRDPVPHCLNEAAVVSKRIDRVLHSDDVRIVSHELVDEPRTSLSWITATRQSVTAKGLSLDRLSDICDKNNISNSLLSQQRPQPQGAFRNS